MQRLVTLGMLASKPFLIQALTTSGIPDFGDETPLESKKPESSFLNDPQAPEFFALWTDCAQADDKVLWILILGIHPELLAPLLLP